MRTRRRFANGFCFATGFLRASGVEPRGGAVQAPGVENPGKLLVFAGLALAAVGALLWLGGRIFPWLGRLPGDIRIDGERGSFHFPVVTCLLVSLLLSALLALFRRFFGS